MNPASLLKPQVCRISKFAIKLLNVKFVWNYETLEEMFLNLNLNVNPNSTSLKRGEIWKQIRKASNWKKKLEKFISWKVGTIFIVLASNLFHFNFFGIWHFKSQKASAARTNERTKLSIYVSPIDVSQSVNLINVRKRKGRIQNFESN